MTTRAVRNNNPGNLWTGGKTIFPGQIGSDANGFAIFNNWDAGVSAADSNLLSYSKYGIDTPKEIVYGNGSHGGWSTTDQGAYANNIAGALGVDPNAHIDLTNPAIRQSVLSAIFQQEDSNYKATTTPGSQIWDSIQSAAASGNPIEMPFKIMGAIADAAHGVVAEAFNQGASAVSGITPSGGLLNFDLGNWFNEKAKNYVIPIALGFGALLLILVSSWGLVKDTPTGKMVSTGTKTVAGLAVV